MKLKSIGFVRGEVREPTQRDWESMISEIIVAPDFAAGLDGIEGFSHLVVLCWLHRVGDSEREATRIHPQNRQDLPLVGTFATHSPCCPNPIGLVVVPLQGRRGNCLRVRGLGAFDGTLVLDIKPYLPRGDSIDSTTVPWWIGRIWEQVHREKAQNDSKFR